MNKYIVVSPNGKYLWYTIADTEFHNFWPSVQFDINVGGSYQPINIELVQ